MTASEDALKRCPSCKTDKPRAQFNNDKTNLDGKCYWCKACYHQYYQDRKTKLRELKYGTSDEDYQLLLAQQDGTCAICRRSPSGRDLCVDHCHRSGRVRGLLCGKCNTAIGLLEDSPELMNSAIRYLTQDSTT